MDQDDSIPSYTWGQTQVHCFYCIASCFLARLETIGHSFTEGILCNPKSFTGQLYKQFIEENKLRFLNEVTRHGWLIKRANNYLTKLDFGTRSSQSSVLIPALT